MKPAKGFSGISSMATDIKAIIDATEREIASLRVEGNMNMPSDSSVSGNNRAGIAKWIVGIAALLFMLWVFFPTKPSHRSPPLPPPTQNRSVTAAQTTPAQHNDKPPHNQSKSNVVPSAVTPVTPTPSQTFEKPPVGTNNILTLPQLRWCLREKIRLETMRALANNNKAIAEFNAMVDDYNARCGSFRYRQSDMLKAESDVEAMRSKIIQEAINETNARRWN